MKNFKLKITFTLLISILLVSVSCTDWIDTDINIDPDAPSDVPMNLLLPAIQQSMGYNLMGNDNVRTNNIWMQQFDGTDRQSFTEARYQLTPADINNLWSSTYTDMLMNSKILYDKAIDQSSPNFAGVSQVLTATTLGITTDLFGDIPYSDALLGGENYKPVYDSQEEIYNTIFSLLDQSVSNLNNSDNVYEVTGDVIYGGDVDKWKKAAYSIKARHLLQLSLKNGNAAYTDALAAASNGFTSNDDNFLVPWEDANHNPIFQFMEQRGDIRMGATLVNMLNDTSDPRVSYFAAQDGNGTYSGSEAGTENTDASVPGVYAAGETAPSKIMTYSELKFIEAEAHFMLGHTNDAQDAFEEAVRSSLQFVMGSDFDDGDTAETDWLNANIIGVPVSMEFIMNQKYIAGFTTNQPYADYRRTGYPDLDVAVGAVLPNIPTRFPYAQRELDYNAANVPSVQISDKLWWDQ